MPPEIRERLSFWDSETGIRGDSLSFTVSHSYSYSFSFIPARSLSLSWHFMTTSPTATFSKQKIDDLPKATHTVSYRSKDMRLRASWFQSHPPCWACGSCRKPSLLCLLEARTGSAWRCWPGSPAVLC